LEISHWCQAGEARHKLIALITQPQRILAAMRLTAQPPVLAPARCASAAAALVAIRGVGPESQLRISTPAQFRDRGPGHAQGLPNAPVTR